MRGRHRRAAASSRSVASTPAPATSAPQVLDLAERRGGRPPPAACSLRPAGRAPSCPLADDGRRCCDGRRRSPGTPGRAAPCSASPRWRHRSLDARLDRLDAAADRRSRARSTPTPSGSPATWSGSTPPLVRVKDAAWAVRRDRLRTAAGVADLAGARSVPRPRSRPSSRSSRRSPPSTASRSAAGTRPGLHVLVHGHGLDLDAPAVRGPARGRATPTRSSQSGAVRAAERPPQLRLQGGRRDRRARRQHRGPPRRHPRRRAAAAGPRRADAQARRARPHPLGQRRDHLAGQRPPRSTPTRPSRRRRPVRRPPRSTATSTTSPTSRPPTGWRSRPRSPPTPRSSPPSCRRRLDGGATSTRPSAAPWPAWRAPWPSPPPWPTPGPAPPRPARERPGALRRPGRRRLHRGQRALRPGRGDRRATSAWTARPRPTPRTPTPAGARSSRSTALAAGTLEGIAPVAYDGTAAAGHRGRPVHRPDHHPRHRPRRRTPTSCSRRSPRPPVSFRKTLRGKLVEQDGQLRVDLGPETLPDGPPRRASAGGHQARRWSSARARPPWPARAWPPASPTAAPDSPVRVEAMLATELSGFGLRSDMADTLVVAISQSGTTTDTNRTVDLVRARGAARDRHRQPPRERPHRQVRRRALHVRRPGRGDERRLHEGLLRADRGRLPAGRRRRRRRPGAASREPDRQALLAGAARPARGAGGDARARGPTSPRRPASSRPVAPVLGHRRQRGEPDRGRARSGSSSPSSATSPSPATAPRTRSTSTSPRSR